MILRLITSFLILGALVTLGCQTSEESIRVDKLNEVLKQAKAINDLAIQGFSNALRPKGLFRYSFNPREDRYSTKNNAIRQLMATRLMAELALEDPDWVIDHNKNLEFLMKYWYKEEGDSMGYVYYNKKSKLGANAMMLRALVVSPFYEKYKHAASQLCNGLLSLRSEDGSFIPFYKVPENYEFDKDYLLTFYSGEALVALLEYAEVLHDDDLLDLAKQSQDYYINKYVTKLEENYYPAYVPWHTISMNKLYKLTKDVKYADAIFVLNDKLLEIQDTTHRVGRFYNPKTPKYGNPHGSSDGVYTEGLVYAYEIAKLRNDKFHQDLYLEAIRLSLINLDSLQYKAEDCAGVIHPERCIGVFRTSTRNEWSRIDTGQHIIDALRKLRSLNQ